MLRGLLKRISGSLAGTARDPLISRAASSYASPAHPTHDVIVVGNGAFGSSAAYHLARQGIRVLTLDMHPPAHAFGSSHGQTRIIRLAYFEGPEYVKLLKRSYNLFLDLQDEIGQEIFFKTGMLDVGATFERSLASAKQYNLPHEVLSAKEVNYRYPGNALVGGINFNRDYGVMSAVNMLSGYSVPEGLQALFQPDGGMLRPEKIIQAHCDLAKKHGAKVVSGERVASWRTMGSGPDSGVEVVTSSGSRYTAGRVVITAGAWMGQLVPEIRGLCVPIRQVVAWFDCPKDRFKKEHFPVFIAGQSADAIWYGFPEYGDQPGFKIGLYNHLNQVVDPDRVDRAMNAEDEEALRRGVRTFFQPAAKGKVLAHGACMFTNTPDGHFIIDRHPLHPQVILCSACSGHGFKMTSGIGQILAEMTCMPVAGGQPPPDMDEELRLHRINEGRIGHKEFLHALKL